jgi:hypothetical protein
MNDKAKERLDRTLSDSVLRVWAYLGGNSPSGNSDFDLLVQRVLREEEERRQEREQEAYNRQKAIEIARENQFE